MASIRSGRELFAGPGNLGRRTRGACLGYSIEIHAGPGDVVCETGVLSVKAGDLTASQTMQVSNDPIHPGRLLMR